MEFGVHRLWNYVELFWNSLDNAPSSMVFYLEMKVEVEVGVHDIRSSIINIPIISLFLSSRTHLSDFLLRIYNSATLD